MQSFSATQGRILFYLISILLVAIIGLWASLFLFGSLGGNDGDSGVLPVLQKNKQEKITFSPIFSGSAQVSEVQKDEESSVSFIQAKTTLNFYDTETGIEREPTVDAMPIKVSPDTEIVSVERDKDGNINIRPASPEDIKPGSKIIFYTADDVLTSFQGPDRTLEAIYIEIFPAGDDPRPQL